MSEACLNVNLRAFGYVFARDLCQALPGHDVVSLGPFLPLVVAVFEPFVGGEAEVCNGSAAP